MPSSIACASAWGRRRFSATSRSETSSCELPFTATTVSQAGTGTEELVHPALRVRDTGTAARYQSESERERRFIELLVQQGYERLSVTDSAELEANLRQQLERLNGLQFSDDEWARFFTERIAASNEGIVERTARIQEDHVQVLVREDGSTKSVHLLDKRDVHRNRLQVLSQYVAVGAKAKVPPQGAHQPSRPVG